MTDVVVDVCELNCDRCNDIIKRRKCGVGD